ncbi:MAG: hypothetical protein Tp1100DCM00d2C33371621_29 [Prokaryotic dsDNA virus sp.]|nr:MAG: hypothetical protein Tp1100DCM00d2C33371621_29 [Prokaryotic dsDNA virus sp.]|tara:strand:+ start:321 stop:599 length:279 start_codon:yes stop_codon:yes gene_type:complete
MMDKAKLNNVMQQVLTEIESNDVKEKVKDEYTSKLLLRLSDLFRNAEYGYCLRNEPEAELYNRSCIKNRKEYNLVKDFISEAVDEYMSKLKD